MLACETSPLLVAVPARHEDVRHLLKQKKRYAVLFWLAQGAVAGMLATFPVGGYWVASIIFSSLHIIIYYAFIFYFLRDLKKVSEEFPLAGMFLKAGLLFLVISTFGPWAVGIISAKGMGGSDLYYQAIYFYLHFQYNGFFTFILLALFLALVQRHHPQLPAKTIKWGFWLLFVAAFPAYVLSLLGFAIPRLAVHVATVSGIVQWAGICLLLAVFHTMRKTFIQPREMWGNIYFAVALLSLFLKFSFQMASGLRGIGEIAFAMTNTVVVGFLHLVMLGMVTCGIIALLDRQGIITLKGPLAGPGNVLFLSGFVAMELLLFLQGLLIWLGSSGIPSYFEGLVASGFMMVVGLVLVILQQVKK